MGSSSLAVLLRGLEVRVHSHVGDLFSQLFLVEISMLEGLSYPSENPSRLFDLTLHITLDT